MTSKPQNASSAKASLSQTKSLSVKQTVQFKAKQQQQTSSAAAAKKSVSKVMNLTGSTKPSSSTATSAKLNTSASKPSSSKAPPASMGKLSHSGVTLSKQHKRLGLEEDPQKKTEAAKIQADWSHSSHWPSEAEIQRAALLAWEGHLTSVKNIRARGSTAVQLTSFQNVTADLRCWLSM